MSNALIDHKIKNTKSYDSDSENQWRATEVRDFNEDVLILLTGGKLDFRGVGCSCNLESGTAVYIKNGTYIWREGMGGSRYKAVEIPISSHFIELFLRKHADSMATCFNPNCDCGYKPISFPVTKLLLDTVNALCEFNASNQPEQLKLHKLEEVLLLLLYSGNGHRLATLLRQTVLLPTERLRTFMESHFLNDWRLHRFAREFGASLTTFKDLFNEVYSVAPKSWINSRRLLYANQLLRSTEKSVVDIALQAGFSSQSYFAQAFRRHFGMTPRQARKH